MDNEYFKCLKSKLDWGTIFESSIYIDPNSYIMTFVDILNSFDINIDNDHLSSKLREELYERS